MVTSFNQRAERHLAEGFKRGAPRFQLEAAISRYILACAHWPDHWRPIALFYEQLVRISPASAHELDTAAAVAEAEGPEAGLAVLESIDRDAVADYQPYWAVRAHLLQKIGKTGQASEAYDRRDSASRRPRRARIPPPNAATTAICFFTRSTANLRTPLHQLAASSRRHTPISRLFDQVLPLRIRCLALSSDFLERGRPE